MEDIAGLGPSGSPNGRPDSPDGGGEGTLGDHLPPPAFPPGSRRIVSRPRRRIPVEEEGVVEGDVPDDAFIDPDEPILRPDPISDDAFFDPDEPIVRVRPPTKPEDYEDVVRGSPEEDFDPDEVVVTGIGDDPHLTDLQGAQDYHDLHVADLVEKVGYLADQLRDKGEAGLRTEPGMSRFEASLRAYCTGYLNARRGSEAK